MVLLRQAARRAMELVLPARCIGCGEPKTYLCDACVGAMEVPSPRTIASDGFSFEGATAAVVYDGVAREAVHRFKFKGLRALGPYMAAPMLRMISSSQVLDVVVPVPLHGSRLRERGYNQAALLGGPIAEGLGVTSEPTWLVRPERSAHQVEARDVAARQANVRSAFVAALAVAGARVALVDDVTTTGATLDAAAAALKEAGAREVHCYTFARDV